MSGLRAVLLAGGKGSRMGPLCEGRLKPLIPFGGVCRLIDFSIANARRSGLTEVLLLSQHEERQLMDDLQQVWWTSDFRVHFGPFDESYRSALGGRGLRLSERDCPMERGTADALIRKAPYIFGKETTEVLVLHADHVYHFDYRELAAAHRAAKAALTITYQRIARVYVSLFGMVDFDAQGNLTRFVEKPQVPTSDLVFAAFCIFDAKVLHRYLELLDGSDWQHDISRDLIPAMLAGGERIRGFPVRGYWEDIGTVERYYLSHIALLGNPPSMSLREMPWTLHPGMARRFVSEQPDIVRSIVPENLDNHGFIEDSVAFPGAQVGKGACVRSSVLLPGACVAEDVDIQSAIVMEQGDIYPMRLPAPPFEE